MTIYTRILRTMMRLSGIVLFVSASVSALAFAEKPGYQFDIQPQSLKTAIAAFSKATNYQFIYTDANINDLKTAGVSGDLTAKEALEVLLQGTKIRYRHTNENTVLLFTEGDKLGMADGIKVAQLGGVSLADKAEDSAGGGKPKYIEEVIITAEKREQDVQDVPVSITAFSADMLDVRGIDSPEDMNFSVPGLVIGQAWVGRAAQVAIRGVGTENVYPGGDPGVPLHINGHYTQSTAYVFRDFLDVERVEIQRGPQGTLYGRNAIGGNINVITKRPTEEFEGMIGMEMGNYSKRQFQAVLSGPLSDKLRGRIVVVDDKRDGFAKDVGPAAGERETSDYTSVRGALEFDVTDTFGAYLNAYYFDDKGSSVNRRISPVTDFPTDPWKVSTNTPSDQQDNSKGVSLDLSWALDGFEIRSLTAFDETEKDSLEDQDGTGSIGGEVYYNFIHDTKSQEFQVLSTSESKLQWITGLFYFKEEDSHDFIVRYDPDYLTALNYTGSFLTAFDYDGDGIYPDPGDRMIFNTNRLIEAESIAIYGQMEYELTNDFNVIFGLRYTEDEKSVEVSRVVNRESGGVNLAPLQSPNVSGVGRQESWNAVTAKLGGRYSFGEDTMMYATWSRGYKSGGVFGPVSIFSTQIDVYDPEYVDSYEVGLKSIFFDNRVQVNLAGYYYDYSDKQDFQRNLTEQGTTTFEIRNASSVDILGFELESQIWLTEAFLVDISASYMNAEFKEFETIDNIQPQLGVIDLEGQKVPHSPEWKFHFGAQYEWNLDSAGIITARADYSWVDEQWSNALNRGDSLQPALEFSLGDRVPSYSHINANLRWESSDSSWLGELYVKNLRDKEIVSNTFLESSTFSHIMYFPPRTYGLKITYKF